MNTTKKLAITATILTLLIPLWIFKIAVPITQFFDLTDNAITYESRIKIITTPGESLRELFETETHIQKTINKEQDLTTILLRATSHDEYSNEIYADKQKEYLVNKNTLQIQNKNLQIFFPQHTQKKNYLLQFTTYLPDTGTNFEFETEEKIGNLDTYKFKYSAENIDWTDALANKFPKVIAKDWGIVWVEPYSGTIIKHEEQWTAKATEGAYAGTEVFAGIMEIGSEETNNQINEAILKKGIIQIIEIILPATLATAVLAIITTIIIIKKGTRKK